MKKAHWIRRSHLFRPDEYFCSVCGAVSEKPYRCCPSCGSAMGRTRADAGWVDEAEALSALLDEDW